MGAISPSTTAALREPTRTMRSWKSTFTVSNFFATLL